MTTKELIDRINEVGAEYSFNGEEEVIDLLKETIDRLEELYIENAELRSALITSSEELHDAYAEMRRMNISALRSFN